MIAILNVNKESAYAAFNGHTFRVEGLNPKGVTLIGMGWDLLCTEVDFTFTEILIVDLDNEMRALESKLQDVKAGLAPQSTESLYESAIRSEYRNLQQYCIAHGFEFNYY